MRVTKDTKILEAATHMEIDPGEMHNFEKVVPPSLNLTSYYQNYGFSDKVVCPC